MPKKETKKSVITFIIMDVICIAIFAFIFLITQNMITQSANREDEIKTELKKENSAILMKDDLVSSKAYEDKLAGYVLPSGGTVDFITTIGQLVSNTGLKANIKTVTSVSYPKGDAIGEELLRVDMDVIGGWENIQFFLKSLENYPLKIDVNGLSLNKISDNIVKGKNIPNWSGSFEFTVVKIKDTIK